MAIPEEAVRSGLLLPVPSSGSKRIVGKRAGGPLPKGLSSLRGQVQEQLRAFFQWQNQRRWDAQPLGGGTLEGLCTNLSKGPYLSSEHQSIPQPSTQRQH